MTLTFSCPIIYKNKQKKKKTNKLKNEWFQTALVPTERLQWQTGFNPKANIELTKCHEDSNIFMATLSPAQGSGGCNPTWLASDISMNYNELFLFLVKCTFLCKVFFYNTSSRQNVVEPVTSLDVDLKNGSYHFPTNLAVYRYRWEKNY